MTTPPVLSLHVWLWIYGALLTLVIALGLEWQKLPRGRVTFVMFDVGQGDSLFLQTPSGRQVLMDAGPDLSVLTRLGEVMPKTDRTIDLLILSHPHLDHLAAFPEILRRYRVKAVMLAGMQYPGERYREMLEEMQKKHVQILIPDPLKDLDLGDGIVLDVLWPEPGFFGRQTDEDAVNNTSVALRVLFDNQSILLAGDMEEPEEAAILKSGADVSATILKIAHHGSKTSTSTGFLLSVDPELALISAGRNNKFRHPNSEILERLSHFKIPTRITKDEGSIALQWK
jgi:competence protein ComEC